MHSEISGELLFVVALYDILNVCSQACCTAELKLVYSVVSQKETVVYIMLPFRTVILHFG